MIAESVGNPGTSVAAVPRCGRAIRLMVRLGPAEAAHVDAQATAMGLKRAGWVAALVRRHALGRPYMSSSCEVAVLAIQAEVHRIGVNLNHIARSLNAAVLQGRAPVLELAVLSELREELRAQVQALGQAFRGNLDYWDVGV